MATLFFKKLFTPKFGEEISPFWLAHSFQLGWFNHQLEDLSMKPQNLQQNGSFPSFLPVHQARLGAAWLNRWIGGGELVLGKGSKIKYVVSSIVHDTT